jgi:uncharacterized protein (DUF2267 family)
MEYNEFVKRVQDQADLPGPDEAAAAIKAVLGTLGEMLSPTERRHLAAQLPKSMKSSVTEWMERPPKEKGRPHRFGLEEFYQRVAARSDVRYPTAVRRSQAVMKVLREAIAPGELADVFRELPQEYEELLTGIPRSPVSPTVVP